MPKIYGILESAQLENLGSDPASSLTGLIWINTASSKVKWYDGTLVREAVDTSSTQTLTNKTINGGTFDLLTLGHQSTPASPSAGFVKAYFKNDNQLYGLNSDGEEFAIGSGSGGGLDIFFSQDFTQENATDWTYGSNATFLNGGTAAADGADETGSPISGNRSLQHTQIAGSINDFGASPAISIDEKQGGQWVGITIWYKLTGTTTNDYKAVIYDATNTTVISSSLDLFEPTSTPKVLKFSVFVPSGVSSLRYGYQVVTETIGAKLVIDDIEFSTNPFIPSQFDEEIKVEADQNANDSLTANVTDVPYIATSDTAGLWSGTVFTAPFDGKFHFTGSVNFAGGTTNTNLYYYKNGVQDKVLNFIHTGPEDGASYAFEVDLSAGETISLRSNVSINLANSASNHWIKISGSRRVESIVTPTDSFGPVKYGKTGAQSFTSGATTIIDFDNQVTDRDGLVTTGGSWQFLSTRKQEVEVKVAISFGSIAWTAGQELDLYVYVNGALRDTLLLKEWEASGTFALTRTCSANVSLEDGDTLDVRLFQNSGSSQNINVGATNFIAINPVEKKLFGALPAEQVAYFKDVKSSGTDGGTFTSGAWQTRDLNTVEGDSGFASLSSNQITLSPGTYSYEFSAPGYVVDNHKTRFYNVTDGATVHFGTAEHANSGNNFTIRSWVTGTFTITSSKTFRLEHRCQTTRATDGFGYTDGVVGGDEVYSQGWIKKIK